MNIGEKALQTSGFNKGGVAAAMIAPQDILGE